MLEEEGVQAKGDAKLLTGGASELRRKLLEKYVSGQLERNATEEAVISRRPAGETAPVSFSQEQIWLHGQIAGNIPLYNDTLTVHRHGRLDPGVLEQCLVEIVRRHEIWRTTFESTGDELFQIIHPAPQTFPWQVMDLSKFSEADREAQALRLATEDARRPFDLKTGPLLRALLISLNDRQHRLYMTLHHLIFDAVTAYCVFMPELETLYEAFSTGKPSPLPEPRLQYADFAYWQRRKLSPAVSEHAAYWRKQMAGELPVCQLPTDHPRPPVETHRGAIERFTLPATLIQKLRILSQQAGVSLYMTLLAGFVALLQRYTGQDEIVLGSLTAGRNRVELEEMMGHFVNPLALRFDLGGNPTFQELQSRVRGVVLEALTHEGVPFAEVVKQAQKRNDPSRHPLFQVIFSQQPKLQHVGPGWELMTEEVSNGGSKLDLLWVIDDRGDVVSGPITYNPDLFDVSTIRRAVEHWRTLLQGAADDPSKQIADLPIMTETEQTQVLFDWNKTGVEFPKQQTLHELFEDQAKKTSDAPAVTFEGQRLTYDELNRRANQVAHYLQGLGIGPDVPVGLFLERSLEMIVGILGVLKAGGVCLPLDPAYPSDRLAFMLSETQAPVLLTLSRIPSPLPVHQARVVCLDTEEIWRGEDKPVRAQTSPDNLAYIIYTSGSTGQPKGVRVTHGGLVNSTLARIAYYPQPLHSFLLLSSFTFDSSLAGIFWTLSMGGNLVLPPDQSRWALSSLLSLIQEHGVSHLLCVPSLYKMLLETDTSEQLAPLQVAIVAGEFCPSDLVRQHYTRVPQASLYNEYGPTEATVWCSVYKCVTHSDSVLVPIGRPIANTRLYVLDSRMHPVPIGVPGELHVAGAGVTAGYLNRPELNAQKFVANPFSNNSAEKIYKTGDRVRYLSNGNLEWLGRMDDQIKLRGFRIELGEVEAALSAHASVRRGVVQIREDQPGNQQLVAYVVPLVADQLSAEMLREHLARRLPAHAIPAVFVFLDAIPELPNGKVDPQRLPSPDATSDAKSASVAPRSPVEEVVAGIWAQVLKRDRVGIRDDFFSLGGHSLLAAKVIARILQTLGVELPLRSIFERPTVEGVSALVESSRSDRSGSLALAISSVPRDTDPPPLSFAQQRLWFLDQLEPASALYNVSQAVRISGLLKLPALEQSINEIVRRHSILRTRFAVVKEQPVQIIFPSLLVPLPVHDLTHLPESERENEATRWTCEEAKRVFNLGAGPLIRASLLRLGPEQHILLVTIHHIASDERSCEIFFQELAACYSAFAEGKPSPLPAPPIQYADYAVWQRQWMQGKALKNEVAYWRSKLEGVSLVLELPTDRPRPAVQSFRGTTQSLELSKDVADGLKVLSQREGATIFITLLAAFQALLSRYSGQEDILVGSPFTNRRRAEVEGLIGFFVNTVALRTNLSGNPGFRDLLARVKLTALEAYDHGELPFERVVEELRPERTLSHNPLFQVLFAIQNTAGTVLELHGLKLALQDVDSGTAKFDLTCTVIPQNGTLTTTFEYNTDLFDSSTIARIMKSFHVMLEAIVANPELRLSEMPLLSQAERHRILVEWNTTETDYPRDKCVHQLVEAQAARTPDAVAVCFQHQKMTYRELNQNANRLAHHLRKRGVGADSPVGICLDRSLMMVVAILGVLKAGGACLPLDPDYPKDRLLLMLEDSQAPILLSERGLLPESTHFDTEIICLASNWESISNESSENPDTNITAANLAYVIYTSGSTGRPRGVLLTHGGLVNHNVAATKLYDLRSTDRVLQFSSISFDIALEEIFPTWIVGGTLVLRTGELSLGGSDFLRWAQQQRLTVLNLPTAYWHELVHELSESGGLLPESLRMTIVGGEKASSPAFMSWRKFSGNRVRWINTYGPTETSVIATAYEPSCYGDVPSPLPIGKPIDNVRTYILDRNLQPVPVGIPGELHIGGPGLARGYLNRPELTAEKFIHDPFSDDPDARLYKTGDLARYLSDGNIEFLGRRDFQVKIRGFRVELGEIEAALATHPAVHEAVVIAREDDASHKRLVSYVVPGVAHAPSVADLRSFLKKQLPEYMVPSDFVFLDELPLTPNGKLDRRALPAPPRCITRPENHTKPTDSVESRLVDMWEDVLSKKPVGVQDNFFELGGHSLLAVRLMRRIEQSFGRKLPLTTLFEAPTIQQLAGLLRQDRWAPSWSSLVAVQPKGKQPPFFCVHGLGGTVLRFRDLARSIGSHQPFYGIQAQGLDGERPFHTRVEEMASYYISEIRRVQTDGPYFIGGYSFGGLVAFEMARQLQSDGQEVALLALLDTYPGKVKTKAMLLNTLLRLPREQQLAYAGHKIKTIRKGIRRRFDALFLPRPLKKIREILARAEEAYQPQVLFGKLTWFRASEKGLRGLDNLRDDWSKWIAGEMETHEIDGDHGSILKEPQVHILAEKLRACLDRAQQEPSEEELEQQLR